MGARVIKRSPDVRGGTIGGWRCPYFVEIRSARCDRS
jgi:hypothetical protein